MRKKILLFMFIVILTSFVRAEVEPVKFILFRMDYQNYEVKNLYIFYSTLRHCFT